MGYEKTPPLAAEKNLGQVTKVRSSDFTGLMTTMSVVNLRRRIQ